MPSRARQLSGIFLVSLVALAACSSAADDSGVGPLPTDVGVADDLFIGTEDGKLPTPSTVPASVPAFDLPPTDPPANDADSNDEQTSDSGAAGGAPAPGTPITLPAAQNVPIAPPAAGVTPRIISLSPTHTEMLFAMGAGDLVLAVAEENNFVPAADGLEDGALELRTSLLGNVAGRYSPTLVIVGTDEPITVATIGASGLPLYAPSPARTFDEIYAQIAALGELIGRPADAAALTEQMRGDLDGIVAGLRPLATSGLTFFHEVDPSLVTFDQSNFMSGLFAEIGLTNIFVGGSGAAIPQMTLAQVVAADPDVITLGDVDCCRVTAASLTSRSGWGKVAAVRNGAVVPLTDAEYSGWGPGVVDVLRRVAAAMTRG